jgi:hypothetical protein
VAEADVIVGEQPATDPDAGELEDNGAALSG